MEIKSIKLINFRQFKNASIDFSTDSQKNVTIIIGENGTGKTTLEQAFFWCLYGITKFKDKVVLNRSVAECLTNSSQTAKTTVELRLIHENVNYLIRRIQSFKRATNGSITGQPSELVIGEIKDGNINYKFSGNTPENIKFKNNFIKRILSHELSKYFFFDGEVINEMSSQIATGKKSPQFAEAVKGLTGLRAIQMVLKHLGKGTTGVIGRFNDMFQGGTDDELVSLNKTIAECEEQFEKNKLRIGELAGLISETDQTIRTLENELKTFEEGKNAQEQKEEYERRLKAYKTDQENQRKKICKNFSQNSNKYIGIALVKQALELLAKSDLKGNDIPGIDINTINYLLDRKKCICGTHLDQGTIPYQEVEKLRKFVPPESIGMVVRQFITKTQSDYQTETKLYSDIRECVGIISKDEDEIAKLEELINIIEGQLTDGAPEKVREIQRRINECRAMKRDYENEKDSLYKQQGAQEARKKDSEARIRELVLVDETNKLAFACKAYTSELIKRFEIDYKKRENETRTKLQTYINEMFLEIYGDGICLYIDENYNVSVEVSNLNDVETSTAQSNSVVFAFITAIIKMARENRKTVGYYAEPYPLVMDAPLSTFDRRRIGKICKQIPKIAEQVIIFIKDTDGDLARQHLEDRIYKTYKLEKIDGFHTDLVPLMED